MASRPLAKGWPKEGNTKNYMIIKNLSKAIPYYFNFRGKEKKFSFFFVKRTIATMEGEKKSYILNMGPVHPSLHGVLRLIVQLEGEKILKVDPHIGLLHRGTEKLMESKTYLQGIPYMDRLDYVSMMAQEHCYCMAIEDLLNIEVDKTSRAIRVLFLEITRILNHLLAITTHAMDVGALTPFLWAFEEREKLMSFYEHVSGGRLHATYIRVGGVKAHTQSSSPLTATKPKHPSEGKENNLHYSSHWPKAVADGEKGHSIQFYKLLEEILLFSLQFPSRIDELEELLSNNRIWMGRTMNIGVISKEDALKNSLTGPLIRGSQIPWDLRKTTVYEIYKNLNFNIVVGNYGDSYDRYKVRIEEMRESCKIIKQVISLLSTDYVPVNHLTATKPKHPAFGEGKQPSFGQRLARGRLEGTTNKVKSLPLIGMESIIAHFKYYSKGFKIPENIAFISTEAPKGEFSIFLVSDGTEKIYRCSIKAPGFVHLRAIDILSKKKYIADLITNLGTLDIVLGECDR
jgi:NADH dehydrogenase I D subunit